MVEKLNSLEAAMQILAHAHAVVYPWAAQQKLQRAYTYLQRQADSAYLKIAFGLLADDAA